jgi:putative transposase
MFSLRSKIMPLSALPHDYLRRLPPESYRGSAMVHWTLTVADRRTGWLDANSHACWREVLLHALARYALAAPVYCLMPDHAHLLLVGLNERSDQQRALSFLRRYTARMFIPDGSESASATGQHLGWQKQAYDHVLREEERRGDAFQSVAHYIAENPVRARLVETAGAWHFSGALVAGWPELDWRQSDFWDRWWRIFAVGENAGVDDTGDSDGSESASAT